MSDAIRSMEDAFSDDIEMPLRSLLGPSLFMPGRVRERTGMKVVSLASDIPYDGIVAVFDESGSCLGLVDGSALTLIRTAAGAGLATRLLARPDSRTLAMLGAGATAPDQVAAVKEVRPIGEVLVWSRDPQRAEALARRVDGWAVDDLDEAVSRADVVSAATRATSPLFAAESVQPGTHINAVGAFKPDMCEIPAETLHSAITIVEDLGASAEEAGDLIQADRTPDGTVADLQEGRVQGRQSPEQITVFKSVGIASMDIAAAAMALRRAIELDIGVEVG